MHFSNFLSFPFMHFSPTFPAGMREGGSRHLIVPSSLGYGKQGAPPEIPPNSTLFFDIKVVKAW